MPKESLPESLTCYQEGQAKFWMLLIGVNDYVDPKLPNLSCAVNDCLGLESALDQVTPDFNKVKLVHCNAGDRQTAQNLAADLENIRSSLKRIEQEAEPNDLVLAYFSGHGSADAQGRTYLCLEKTNLGCLSEGGLALQEVFTSLRECKARKQVLLVDACHSGDSGSLSILNPNHQVQSKGSGGAGQIMVAKSSTDRHQSPAAKIVGELDEYAERNVSIGVRFHSLLSCEEDQESYESLELQRGIFTHFLIKGILGDASQNGVIRPYFLFTYVSEQTERYANQRNLSQKPHNKSNTILDFEIGIPQNRDPLETYYRYYCGLRKDGPLDGLAKAKLSPKRRELDIWGSTENVENHLDAWFQNCEERMGEDLESQSFPLVSADCPIDFLNRPREGDSKYISQNDIQFVWQRLVGALSQKFDQFQADSVAQLRHEGRRCVAALRSQVPDGLTQINVQEAIKSWIHEFEQRLERYQDNLDEELKRCIQVEDEIPIALYDRRAALLQELDLPESHPDIQAIDRELLAKHRRNREEFHQSARTIIAQHFIPLPDQAKAELQTLYEGTEVEDEVLATIVEELCETHRQKIDRAEAFVKDKIKQYYPDQVPEADRMAIAQHMGENELSAIAAQIEENVKQRYEAKVAQFEKRVMQDLQEHDRISRVQRAEWRLFARVVDLSDYTARVIEDRCHECIQDAREACKQATQKIIQAYGKSLTEDELLSYLQQERFQVVLEFARQICRQQLEEYAKQLNLYQVAYAEVAQRYYPLTDQQRQGLAAQRSQLFPEDADQIEEAINRDQEQKIDRYKVRCTALIYETYPISEEVVSNELDLKFQRLRHELHLSPETVSALEKEVIEQYRQALAVYSGAAEAWLEEGKPLDDPAVIDDLQSKQGGLEAVAEQIHQEVIQRVEQRRQDKLDQLWEAINGRGHHGNA